MRATLEIYFRTVTTGSMFQWQNGLQNLLICVTSLTCSTNSICHFRGKQLCSGQEIKWLHSNPHQNYGGNEWTLGISDMFQTLAEILKGIEPGPPFSQLMNDRLAAFKSLSNTSQPQKTPKLGRNGSSTHLWKSQVYWLCQIEFDFFLMLEKD